MTVYSAQAAVRWPTLFLLPTPILAGPLRGAWWLTASGGKLARILTGQYEPAQTDAFCRYIQPGDMVIDVGAAAGFYTLLSSRLVGPEGRVVAFEPDPRNAAFVRRLIQLNRLTNVVLHQAAIGAEHGMARFNTRRGSGTGRLDVKGDLEAPVVRLDDILDGLPRPPTHLKIDVEGAEAQALAGAANLLASAAPILFLSTHGSHRRRDCRAFLAPRGYRIEPLIGAGPEAPDWLCIPQRLDT